MPTVSSQVNSGSAISLTREWSPAELGMASLNLKTGTSTFTSNKIPVAGLCDFGFTLRNTVVGTEPTTGAANMTVKAYAADGTTQLVATRTLFATIDLLEPAGTAIHSIHWTTKGAGALAATVTSSASATIGTPLVDTSCFKGACYLEFIFNQTTVVNTATSSVLDCYLRAST